MLFRAVGRIRAQLERADSDLRSMLAEELNCLRRLGDQYIDHWLSLDEQIDELFAMYELEEESASPATKYGTIRVPQYSLENNVSVHSAYASPVHFSPGNPVETEIPHFSASDDGEATQDDALDAEWQWLAFEEPDTSLLSFRQGMGYYDLFMFDEASDSLQRAVDDAEHPIARLYLAAAHVGRGRYEEALSQVEKVRSLCTHPIVQCATLEIEAQVHILTKEVGQAIRCLQEIIELRPDYRDVWYNLGVCLAHQGDFQGASVALRHVLDETPHDIVAVTTLIRILLHLGDVSQAKTLCERTRSEFPQHVRLRHAMAEIFEHEGNTKQAIAVLRQIVATNPEDSWPWNHLAWLLMKDDMPGESMAVLKKRLSVKPNHYQTLIQLGIASLMTGDIDRAEENMEHALTCCKNEGSAKGVIWIGLSRVSSRRGDLAKSHEQFLHALQDSSKPVKRLALFHYGLSLLEHERWEDSEKYLKAASHLGPPNPAILLSLARAVQEQGRPLEAEKLRSRALRTKSS